MQLQLYIENIMFITNTNTNSPMVYPCAISLHIYSINGGLLGFHRYN